MYKKNKYKILSNEPLTKAIYKMVLEGDTQYLTAPGQFVNVEIPSKFLRRPISVCDWTETTMDLIYKVVGEGTDIMSHMKAGEELDLLTGLGNGFSSCGKALHPLVVGGGVGLPPLYNLVKFLQKQGKRPTVVMGFNTAEEIFYFDEFKALGVDVFVSTVDGTGGTKGFVTDAVEQNLILFDYLYACGPILMLKTIATITPVKGQLSFEERMGCGFGACVGCSMMTKNGAKRVCKEGPIFDKDEIIWK